MTRTDPQHPSIPRFDPAAVSWKKASGSSNNGGCVEVATIEGMVAVRDSKNPHRPPHFYTREEFRYFLEGAKAGEFDEFS